MVGMTSDEPFRVAGLLLAAGAGRRMGGPKALLRHRDGRSWVASAVRVLLDGGCDGVIVVVGARSDEVTRELGVEQLDAATNVDVVLADDWESGMGASLRSGLAALAATDRSPSDAALVHLVDLPDVTAPVVRRLLVSAPRDGAVLARAGYQGAPGHPVLIGRDHWAATTQGTDGARGDRGARDYLSGRSVQLIECGDLASGSDRDTVADL